MPRFTGHTFALLLIALTKGTLPLQRPTLPFGDESSALSYAAELCESFRAYFSGSSSSLNTFSTVYGNNGDIFNDNSMVCFYKTDASQHVLGEDIFNGYDEIRNIQKWLIKPGDTPCSDISYGLIYDSYILQWSGHHSVYVSNDNIYEPMDVTWYFEFNSVDNTLERVDIYSQFYENMWHDLDHNWQVSDLPGFIPMNVSSKSVILYGIILLLVVNILCFCGMKYCKGKRKINRYSKVDIIDSSDDEAMKNLKEIEM